MTGIGDCVEDIEFCEHLLNCFGARLAPVKLDDIAELAQERTAARKLHPDIQILRHLEEIETWDRRLGNIGLKFWSLEDTAAFAAMPSGDKIIDDALGLAEDADIRDLIDVRARRDVGAAHDDGFA